MRYLVISDTHGHLGQMSIPLQEGHPRVDGVICAGDFYRDGLWLARRMGIPCFGAQGNNDHDAKAPWATFWQVHGVRLGVIHGHQWSSHKRLAGLGGLAGRHRLHVLVFGHSHQREQYRTPSALLVNPGAGFRPVDSPPSLGWLDIDTEGSLNFAWDVFH